MNYLKNTGEIHGTYDDKELEVISNETETLLVEGVVVEKLALRETWPDDGTNLGFSITVTNTSGTDILNATFEDELDTSIATLVEDSVLVDGIEVPYQFVDGRLTVSLGTISSTPIVITFEVRKVKVD